MKVFIGSSREASDIMQKIAVILESLKVTPIKWNKPGLFPAGQFTLETLSHLCKSVDAAIFIYGEDDKIWYREEIKASPRDNVIYEHGLFTGHLGRDCAIVIVNKSPKLASDLSGLTYINFSEGSEERATAEIETWINYLKFKKNKNDTDNLTNDPRLTLEEYFGRIRSQNTLPYFISNDIRALQISDIPINETSEQQEFYLRDYSQFYSVIPIDKNCEFDFSFYTSFNIPKGFSKEDLINLGYLSLSIKVGTSSFDLNNIDITTDNEDASRKIVIQLKKKLKVEKQTDCVIQFKNPVSKYINVELLLLRYPTKGFSFRLEYSDKLKYDYHWFKTNVLMHEANLNIQTIDKKYKDGFFIYTNDWMLVGEGVVACWY